MDIAVAPGELLLVNAEDLTQRWRTKQFSIVQEQDAIQVGMQYMGDSAQYVPGLRAMTIEASGEAEAWLMPATYVVWASYIEGAAYKGDAMIASMEGTWYGCSHARLDLTVTGEPTALKAA